MLAGPATLSGQTEAQITGRITDPSGAVIQGARITVINDDTGIKRETASNDSGYYAVPLLKSGKYRITVRHTGFKAITRTGITLQVMEKAELNFVLEVGALTEQVEVTAGAPLLNTSEATQGQVIDNRRMIDMPLNGRDYLQLALLSAGTAVGTSTNYGPLSVSGQESHQTNFLLEGLDNNNLQIGAQGRRAEPIKPSVDAIQEFKILTNSFSAEYGRALGGVVNIALKSGTNELHGSAFEFLRNEKVDAKNFFDLPDQPKPPFKRNQFGFTLGGPIKKNRAFFFGDYEGSRIRESGTIVSTIAPPAQIRGDFSGTGTTIYDPRTYDPSTGLRQPFANNEIPPDRIDRVAKQAAAWYPSPQNNQLTQNFVFNPPAHQDVDKWDIKTDFVLRTSDTLYFRISRHNEFLPPSPNLPAPAYGGGASAGARHRPGTSIALGWNHIFTPAVISSTRLSWNKFYTDTVVQFPENINRELGLAGVDQTTPGAPGFSISGMRTLGIGVELPNIVDSQNRQLAHDTTWIKQNHNVKIGANIQFLQSFFTNPRASHGVFSFNGNFSRQSRAISGQSRGGQAFADFLLGIPVSARVSNWVYANLRAPWSGFYIQDEWRVTRELTLNLGVRYERNLPWVETRNGMSNFDIDTDPKNPRLVPAREGSRFDRATTSNSAYANSVVPRLGFSARLLDKTVVRGGYAMFFMNYINFGGGQFLTTNPPYQIEVTLTTDSITPAFVLQDGVPAGIVTVEGMRNLELKSYERNPPTPLSQQWNINIQQELGPNTMLEVGYYGSKANHAQQRFDANYAPPGPGDINTRRRFTQIVVPGPDIVVSPLAGAFRHANIGNNLFHSGQIRIEKRFSSGFSVLGSYMLSRAIGDDLGSANPQNPLDRRAERGLQAVHMKHRLVASYIYDLPFGRGRRWWGSSGEGVNLLFGGWSVSGITTMAAGQPFNLSVNGNPANTGGPNRPNVVGDPNLSRDERTLDRFFNTSAFVPNAQYTFGNAGRNILIGPGLVNFDLGLFKRFRVTEDKFFQFRFEAFNAFNTPQFEQPNSVVGNLDFGRITSAGRPRNLQFGLKFVF
jgi:hypothetical protein